MDKMRTSLLLVWNLLLTAAVVFLALRGASPPSGPSPAAAPAGEGTAPSIVYVNTDTLLEHYPYYKELNEAFKRKQDSVEKIINGRAAGVEQDIKRYQDRAGTMTPDQRQAEEEQLYARQQSLMQFREDLFDRLGKEEAAMTEKLHLDLTRKMKEINEGKYQLIFGYQQNSGILFAVDSLDRTEEIIGELKKQASE